jgi:hypothetical protein
VRSLGGLQVHAALMNGKPAANHHHDIGQIGKLTSLFADKPGTYEFSSTAPAPFDVRPWRPGPGLNTTAAYRRTPSGPAITTASLSASPHRPNRLY